jgi:hypothetical protein
MLAFFPAHLLSCFVFIRSWTVQSTRLTGILPRLGTHIFRCFGLFCASLCTHHYLAFFSGELKLSTPEWLNVFAVSFFFFFQSYPNKPKAWVGKEIASTKGTNRNTPLFDPMVNEAISKVVECSGYSYLATYTRSSRKR